MELLNVSHLKKIYTTRFGGTQVQALSDVNFSVEEGEFVAIMGESGSGKTTLLNILATLDKPTAGEVLLSGVDMGSIPEKQLAMYRRNNLGFVFQDFNLLDTFSMKDNIMLPLVLSGKTYSEMAPKMMVNNPKILLADEPTGALDSRAAAGVMDLFESINREGQTILMVTHSIQAASHASRVLFIKDGEVYHQIYRGMSGQREMLQKISDTLTLITAGREEV